MDSHTIAGVHGVFSGASPAVRRPHIPRGARTHIPFTAKSSGSLSWTMRAVKSTGTTAESASLEADSLSLVGLISSDFLSQTRITRHTPAVEKSEDDSMWSSTPLPSAQRICCMQLSHDTIHALRSVNDPARHPTPRLLVADVVGNVYHVTLPSDSVELRESGERPAKRSRLEPSADIWQMIASATAGEGESVGAPGWCGLAAPTARASTDVICAREFFFDVRLIDTTTGTVVRTYGTTHSPTGMTACRGMPHAVAVAEGPLATVYDTRCPAVVFTAKSGHAVHENKEDEEERRNKGKEGLPLVTSRLTCPSAYVHDICETCNEFELAAAVGRSLSVYDARKWNCLSVTTNVLKYEIGAIAPFANGRAFVASGIDAEVRSLPYKKNTPNNNNHRTNNGVEGKQVEENAAEVATFRNRIDSVVSCKNVWRGGWVPSIDETRAVGLSADQEIFIAYKNNV